MTAENKPALISTGEATAILPAGNVSPITVIGTEAIRATFDDQTLRQAIHSRLAPGVTDVVLNPDAHVGYGAPIGCVMVSPSHIYPGPVGVDIKCSMSLLQLNLPADAIAERPTRRALIDAICDRTPTGPGMGQRNVPKSRQVDATLGPAGRDRRRLRRPCVRRWAFRPTGPRGAKMRSTPDTTTPGKRWRIGSIVCWPPEPFPSSPRRSRNLAPTEAETILANVNWFMWPTASGHAKSPGFSV